MDNFALTMLVGIAICVMTLFVYFTWYYWPRPREYEIRLLARVWIEDNRGAEWRRACAYLVVTQAKRIVDGVYDLRDIPHFLKDQAA